MLSHKLVKSLFCRRGVDNGRVSSLYIPGIVCASALVGCLRRPTTRAGVHRPRNERRGYARLDHRRPRRVPAHGRRDGGLRRDARGMTISHSLNNW